VHDVDVADLLHQQGQIYTACHLSGKMIAPEIAWYFLKSVHKLLLND